MKFKQTSHVQEKLILANDHYVAIPYDCTSIEAADGVVKAGTVIPANDSTAIGVLLTDVYKDENPNGTIVIHGFIDVGKMATAPAAAAITALKDIRFLKNGGVYVATA